MNDRPKRPISLLWPGSDQPVRPSQAQLECPLALQTPLALVHGDNGSALHALQSTHGSEIMLIYFDPPFFTGRAHVCTRKASAQQHSLQAFDDRWPDLASYLESLRDRMEAAWPLLAPEGCLVVHVDPKTSHYVRVLGDTLFGPQAFASEIVWRYRRWPSRTRNFQRVHDILLRFVRNPKGPSRFCQLYEPLAQSTQAVWRGRRQQAVLDASGRRSRSSMLEEPSPGTPLGDVWDIGIVAPSSRERTGFPTQKPQALLERLLLTCSEPGDIVLDATLGSGTTLLVAARLGRRAIGIDASEVALQITRKRLKEAGYEPFETRLQTPHPATA